MFGCSSPRGAGLASRPPNAATNARPLWPQAVQFTNPLQTRWVSMQGQFLSCPRNRHRPTLVPASESRRAAQRPPQNEEPGGRTGMTASVHPKTHDVRRAGASGPARVLGLQGRDLAGAGEGLVRGSAPAFPPPWRRRFAVQVGEAGRDRGAAIGPDRPAPAEGEPRRGASSPTSPPGQKSSGPESGRAVSRGAESLDMGRAAPRSPLPAKPGHGRSPFTRGAAGPGGAKKHERSNAPTCPGEVVTGSCRRRGRSV